MVQLRNRPLTVRRNKAAMMVKHHNSRRKEVSLLAKTLAKAIRLTALHHENQQTVTKVVLPAQRPTKTET